MNFELETYIERLRLWSIQAKGETDNRALRAQGLIAHIHKEMEEIRRDPDDVIEYCDVFMLACDLALRLGSSSFEIAGLYDDVKRTNITFHNGEIDEILESVGRRPILFNIVFVMQWAERSAAQRGFDEAAFQNGLLQKLEIIEQRKYPPVIEGVPNEHIREPVS